MKTHAFRRALSAALLIVFSTHSIVWAGPKPELKASALMAEVVTRFDQSRSYDEFLKGKEGLLTTKDISTFKQKLGDWSKLKKSGGVGIKGRNLVVTLGADKAEIGIVNVATYTFSINGKKWQLNPFQSVEANEQSLNRVLSQKQHALLDQIWSALFPEANAFGFIALLILLLIGVVAVAAISAWASSSGYQKVECQESPPGSGNFNIHVIFENSKVDTQDLVINTNPPSLNHADPNKAALFGPICSLNENWSASATCPKTMKILADLPDLKTVAEICKDPERRAKLDAYFSKSGTRSSGRVTGEVNRLGSEAPN